MSSAAGAHWAAAAAGVLPSASPTLGLCSVLVGAGHWAGRRRSLWQARPPHTVFGPGPSFRVSFGLDRAPKCNLCPRLRPPPWDPGLVCAHVQPLHPPGRRAQVAAKTSYCVSGPQLHLDLHFGPLLFGRSCISPACRHLRPLALFGAAAAEGFLI